MKKYILIITLALSIFSSRSEAAGKWTKATYSDGSASKDYFTYTPANLPTGLVPLVVMIHGCTQDAEIFAADTGMNQLADTHGFMVLYPQQDTASNIQKCWNFFDPKNQVRGGEPAMIVGMIHSLEKSASIDSNRIYVAGLSSGAAMSAILAACYSDVFAGSAIAAGLEFEAANSTSSAYIAMAMGSSVDPKKSAADAVRCAGSQGHAQKIFAIQGTGDTTVSPKNLAQIVQQFSAMNILLEGASALELPAPVKSFNAQVPNGRSYSVNDYADAKGITMIEEVKVNGMNHAWSGGPIAAQYVDQTGPNASEMLLQFFSLTK